MEAPSVIRLFTVMQSGLDRDLVYSLHLQFPSVWFCYVLNMTIGTDSKRRQTVHKNTTTCKTDYDRPTVKKKRCESESQRNHTNLLIPRLK